MLFALYARVKEKLLKKNNTPFVKIGQITDSNLVIKDEGKSLVDLKVNVLRDLWKNAIWNIMG